MEEFLSRDHTFSPSLFVYNDIPMEFYLPPHRHKAAIRSLIEKGGGKMAKNNGGIRLLYPECMAHSYGMVAMQFIIDSIEKNVLQKLVDYNVRLKHYFYNVDDKIVKLMEGMPTESKMKYTQSEDVAILEYVLKKSIYVKAGGNLIWQAAEQQSVTNHSWQSMKDRFRRYIVPNLNNYPTIDYKLRNSIANFFRVKTCKRPELQFRESGSSVAANNNNNIEDINVNNNEKSIESPTENHSNVCKKIFKQDSNVDSHDYDSICVSNEKASNTFVSVKIEKDS